MARRLLFLCLLSLLAAAPAVADDVYDRKQSVDSKLSTLRDRIAASRERERELAAEIAAVTADIRSLEARVGDVSRRLEVLEHDLALHRSKLERLAELLRLQTRRFQFLERQYGVALERLNQRVVAIYQSERVGTLDVVLDSASWSDLLEGIDLFNQIGLQDKRIATSVGDAKVDVRQARERTRRTRTVVASATRVISIRTSQARALRDELVARESRLAAARSGKQDSIETVRESREEFLAETEALSQVSAQLAGQIRSTQSAAPAAAPAAAAPVADIPSSSGLVWPVSGPVTSVFGWRWGRMHEGIDIAAPAGAPIVASAAGRVVYASWMGGYGNLVVVDHGGGLATAYAHQSSIAVTSGQSVGQGQTVGYIGCTGHCYGPHLHFEVRVNGSAVDPLGYL